MLQPTTLHTDIGIRKPGNIGITGIRINLEGAVTLWVVVQQRQQTISKDRGLLENPESPLFPVYLIRLPELGIHWS